MCSKKPTNDDVLMRLAECRAPFLIGVRHHSAALARVMPELLAQFRPKSVLVEMPPEFEPWLEYLGRSDLETPVALAACDETRLISFYPLADFSPELAAIRWAAKHKTFPLSPATWVSRRCGSWTLARSITIRESDRRTALGHSAQPICRARQWRAVGKTRRNTCECLGCRGDSQGGTVLRLDGSAFVERSNFRGCTSRSGNAGGGGGGA